MVKWDKTFPLAILSLTMLDTLPEDLLSGRGIVLCFKSVKRRVLTTGQLIPMYGQL